MATNEEVFDLNQRLWVALCWMCWHKTETTMVQRWCNHKQQCNWCNACIAMVRKTIQYSVLHLFFRYSKKWYWVLYLKSDTIQRYFIKKQLHICWTFWNVIDKVHIKKIMWCQYIVEGLCQSNHRLSEKVLAEEFNSSYREFLAPKWVEFQSRPERRIYC
jgi:hypothetical protein